MSWYPFYTHFKREFLRFFKVPNTTIFPQLVSVLLYLLVFGFSLGARIQEVAGLPYVVFVIPGLIVLNVITASYSNTSGSLFVSRWVGNIKDVLLSPISYTQMVLLFILAAMARGLTLGLGTYLITLIFAPTSIAHPHIFVFYLIGASFVFACAGIPVGLAADKWEQLNIFLNFFLTPLIFLGGVFYTLDMIPPALSQFTEYNPIFYIVDGVRYGMLGISETNLGIGAGIIFGLSTIMFVVVHELFKRGWKLRT